MVYRKFSIYLSSTNCHPILLLSLDLSTGTRSTHLPSETRSLTSQNSSNSKSKCRVFSQIKSTYSNLKARELSESFGWMQWFEETFTGGGKTRHLVIGMWLSVFLALPPTLWFGWSAGDGWPYSGGIWVIVGSWRMKRVSYWACYHLICPVFFNSVVMKWLISLSFV